MIYLIASVVFIINIPFGFWRGGVKKFSLSWFIAIHLPVIISIVLRKQVGIEFHILNLLLFISVFIMGQFTSKKLRVLCIKNRQ